MKRSLPSLAFLLALPLTLFSQTSSQNVSQPSAPSFTQPAFGQKLHVRGIPNAGKISEVLYRGAQPREVGLSELKILGINTIVDLRGEDRKNQLGAPARRSLGHAFCPDPRQFLVSSHRRTACPISLSPPRQSGAQDLRALPLWRGSHRRLHRRLSRCFREMDC